MKIKWKKREQSGGGSRQVRFNSDARSQHLFSSSTLESDEGCDTLTDIARGQLATATAAATTVATEAVDLESDLLNELLDGKLTANNMGKFGCGDFASGLDDEDSNSNNSSNSNKSKEKGKEDNLPKKVYASI